jgi:hypothetical protein
MPDPYHEWADRELVKDHEVNPEAFRKPIITKPNNMNKDNAHLYREIFEALINGKTVQYTSELSVEQKWEDKKELSFVSPPQYYRIKPEPREFFLCVEAMTAFDFEGQAIAACRQFQSNPVRVREILD